MISGRPCQIARLLNLKQNVWFQEGICPEQNGRVSDVINLNMPDIGQTVPDCQTITILVIQNVRLDMR